MASITTTNNELLPIININNIFIGQNDTTSTIIDTLLDSSNLYLTTNFDILQLVSDLDQIISDVEYYKYVRFAVEVLNESSILQQYVFYLNNEVYEQIINKQFTFNNLNSNYLDLKISATLDFNKFSSEYPLTAEQFIFVNQFFSQSRSITYPILRNSLPVQQFDDLSFSIVKDYRLVDGLSTYEPEIIKSENDQKYLNDIFYVTNTNDKYFAFVTFEYKKFLVNNSFIIADAELDYEIDINIFDNDKLIDTVKFTNNSFTSLNNISTLQTKTNENVVLSFYGSIINEPDEFLKLFTIQLVNHDKTLIKFKNTFDNTGKYYDVLNQFTQIKNTILLASNYSDINFKPYYLSNINNMFTQEFINFYNEQIEFFKQYNIDITTQNFIRNFVTLIYNKFTKIPISISNLTNIVDILNLQTSSYDVWLKAIIIFEQIFNKIEALLINDVAQIPYYIYQKQYNDIKFEKNYAFYSLTDEYEYDKYSIVTLNKIQNNFTNGYTVASYFTDNNIVTEISSTVAVDSEIYNKIFSYSNYKKSFSSKSTSKNNILSFTNLEEYGVTIEYQKTNVLSTNQIKNKSTDYPTSNESLANKKAVSNTFISTKDFSNLDSSQLKSIDTKNVLLASILGGKNIKNNVQKDYVAPKIKLSKFNLISNQWQEILVVEDLKDQDFVKAELIESPTLVTISGVSQEKIDFINTYFIMRIK